MVPWSDMVLPLLLLGAVGQSSMPHPPSILFAAPQPLGSGWVNLELMRALHNGSWAATDAGTQRGWSVDFTTSLAELNRSRLFQYNVVVLFVSPAATLAKVGERLPPVPPSLVRDFGPAVQDYAAAGGGVFLYPSESNWGWQRLFDITSLFGARLPVEVLRETNATNSGCMRHMSRGFCLPIAYFDDVEVAAPSKITAGVKGCWLPTHRHYNGGDTGPIVVDNNWTVVLRGSASTVTEAVNLTDPVYLPPPPNQIFARPGGVRAPPLFAVRSFGLGRIALLNSWRQYTLGGGQLWLFDNQVLAAGVGSRPSHVGRLLANTFRWLAEPSWKNQTTDHVGGWVQPAGHLDAPNNSPAVKAKYADTHYRYNPEALSQNPAGGTGLGIRGVIGLKTNLSSGSSTVKDFAATAAAFPPSHKVGFLVFLEDFVSTDGSILTQQKLEYLKAECVEHSTASLQLVPGFTIETNLGNKMMFIGPGVPYPPRSPKDTLTADGRRLSIQPRDPAQPRNFTGVGADIVGNWLLTAMDSAAVAGKGWNVGYYHLGPTRAAGALGLSNLIDSSLAGTSYYNSEGNLVEDLALDYLYTAGGGIAPIPVVVSDVLDARSLIRAATTAVTVARVALPSEAFSESLAWNNQYAAPPTYTSTNDIRIDAWEGTMRQTVLAAERFVVGRGLMPAGLSVSSPAGLHSVSIYNGARLFRRFLLDGQGHFFRTLLLDAFIHRNLVVIATDKTGKTALSFPRRSWKGGVRSVEYCGDHCNDCQSLAFLAARGPYSPTNAFQTPLPVEIAGVTWDGGPGAVAPILVLSEVRPSVVTSKGEEDTRRFTQTPTLDFADEGCTAVTATFDTVFDWSLESVINPWVSFGPLAGAGRLIKASLSYREFYPAAMGLRQVGPAPGFIVSTGMIATLFRHEITFRQSLRLHTLNLMSSTQVPPNPNATTIVLSTHRNSSQPQVLANLSSLKACVAVVINPGGWWGLWSPGVVNAQLFAVRGVALQLRICSPQTQAAWFTARAAATEFEAQSGEQLVAEFAQFGLSLASQLPKAAALLQLQQYLYNPPVIVHSGQSMICSLICDIVTGMGNPSNFTTELSAPHYVGDANMMLPLRVGGLNPRWSAGLWQKYGFAGSREAIYGNGTDRYTALGVDEAGWAYIPLYVGEAATRVVVGHPVVADGDDAEQLFIQTTHVDSRTWHVHVNNPTNATIRAVVRSSPNMSPCGFSLRPMSLELAGGQDKVLL